LRPFEAKKAAPAPFVDRSAIACTGWSACARAERGRCAVVVAFRSAIIALGPTPAACIVSPRVADFDAFEDCSAAGVPERDFCSSLSAARAAAARKRAAARPLPFGG
jgi:hypothetical protein